MKTSPNGFAMVIFLAMAPIVAIMAWTFLTVGTGIRNKSLAAERRLRAMHTAEAALRYHLLTGQAVDLQLNDCRGRASAGGTILASGSPLEDLRVQVKIELTLDKGFVSARICHE